MSTALIHAAATTLASIADLDALALDAVAHAIAPNTQRAYASDWQHFTQWCAAHQFDSLPATSETVRRYISALAPTHKIATIQRRLVAISQAHQTLPADPAQPKGDRMRSPTSSIEVRKVMQGYRRQLGTAQTQKAAVEIDDLKAMLATIPQDTLRGKRDRSLLLIGFAGAFRRSELVSFDYADVRFSSEGVSLHLRHSKTDRTGEGTMVAIPKGLHAATCPKLALQTWLKAAGITEGPIFRAVSPRGQVAAQRLTDKTVANVIKRAAKAAGLDPALYSGHSLRAGLATAAAKAGVEERDIMRQTRHKSVTIARRYIRQGTKWHNNAAGKVGL